MLRVGFIQRGTRQRPGPTAAPRPYCGAPALPLSYLQVVRLMDGTLELKESKQELLSV